MSENNEKNVFEIRSKADGLMLSVMTILPKEKSSIKGIVQLVHGMCEYKERYTDFMEYLADNGYACIIHDHRGHGHSIKAREDLGYFYDGGWQGLVEDIHQVLEYMKEHMGGNLPYYLLGHSMGSLAVRCFVKKYNSDIDKLFVVGCPSQMAGMQAGLALIKTIEKVKGPKAHSKVLDELVVNSHYEKKYADEGIVHAWVNSDRASVEAYNADPLCNYTFTVNGYENLVRMTMETYSGDNYRITNPKLMIRFLSGEGDPCGISKKDIWEAMQCMKNAGFSNVRGKIYEGMRHEILNEPEHMKVYRDILYYMEN